MRRWRPAFGYAVAGAWAFQMGALGWASVSNPEAAPALLEAASSLAGLWLMALSVLGVNVVRRSRDKEALLASLAPAPPAPMPPAPPVAPPAPAAPESPGTKKEE